MKKMEYLQSRNRGYTKLIWGMEGSGALTLASTEPLAIPTIRWHLSLANLQFLMTNNVKILLFGTNNVQLYNLQTHTDIQCFYNHA